MKLKFSEMFYFDFQFTQLKDRKMIDLFGENLLLNVYSLSNSLTSDEKKITRSSIEIKLPSTKTSYK